MVGADWRNLGSVDSRTPSSARRRKAPGRPITYGTTTKFLVEFGLNAIGDLPGLDELKGAGLFEGKLPTGYDVPQPDDAPALRADEDPLEDMSFSAASRFMGAFVRKRLLADGAGEGRR